MKLTANQERAINTSTNKNFLVSASAGTGKTTVMVRRIKELVEKKHIPLSKMVVVTFSNLAAAEMKEKLFLLLSQSEDSFALSERERIDSAAISTIHSFCANLVREFFYLTGIDPNFTLPSEYETKKLLNNAIDDIFEHYYKTDAQFLDLVEIYGTNRNDEGLKKIITNIFYFGQCLESLPDMYKEATKTANNEFVSNGLNQKLLNECLAYKEQAQNLAYRFGGINATTLAAYFGDIALQLSANDKNDFLGNVQILSEVQLANYGNNLKTDTVTCPPDDYDWLFEFGKNLKTAISEWIKTFKDIVIDFDKGQNDDNKNVVLTDKLVKITLDVERRFAEYKRDRNFLDFNDLEHFALKILSDKNAQKEIFDRYDYIFVDEYQDTNEVQEAILNKIKKEDNFFAVGDVKQSIYGFRQSDPDIFVHRGFDYAKNSQANNIVFMNDNFRCNSEIATFVNLLFDGLMTKEFGQVDYKNTGILISNQKCKIDDGQKSVVFANIEVPNLTPTPPTTVYDPTNDEKTVFDGMDCEGEYIAQQIKELVRCRNENGELIEYKDIVVLLFSVKNDAIAIYKKLMEAGIPAVINEGSVETAKEIFDLIAFFKVLQNPLDDYSLCQVLLSPLCGLSVDELAQISQLASVGQAQNCSSATDDSIKTEVSPCDDSFFARVFNTAKTNNGDMFDKIKKFDALIKQYRMLSAVTTADELLLRLLEQTEYERYVLGLPNGEIRLSKLLSFVSGTVGKTVNEIVDEQQDNNDENSTVFLDGNAVRIMTIHASKGLEFDVVFLAGISKGFKADGGNVLLSKYLGVATKNFDRDTKTTNEPPKYLLAKHLLTQKNKEERMRVLYVAATRAKRKLYLVADENKADRKSKFLASKATSLLDFVEMSLRNKGIDIWKNSDYDCFCTRLISAVKLCNDQKDSYNTSNCDDTLHTDVVSDKTEKLKTDLVAEHFALLDWQYPYLEESKLPLKAVSSQLDKLSKNDFEEYQNEEVCLVVDDNFDLDDIQTFEDKPKEADIKATQQPKTDTLQDRTELGKAYHKMFEKCDLSNLDGLQSTLQQLVREGWILEETANQMDLSVIKKCLQNPQFVDLLKNGKICRELPFLTMLPYSTLFDGGSDQKIMLQGVIDLLIINDDKATVIDFKVTRHPQLVKQNYQKQLNSYVAATEQILKVKAEAYVFCVLDNVLIKM